MNKEETKAFQEIKNLAGSMPPIVSRTIWATQLKSTLKRLEEASKK